MKTVKELLKGKSPKNWSVPPTATVFDAVELLNEKDVSALLVMKDDELVGILSERDCVRRVIHRKRDPKHMRVEEVMSKRIYTVAPDQTIETCMTMMIDKGIRHLPVVDKDKVKGILSIRDLVQEILEEKDYWIRHLEKYITGG